MLSEAFASHETAFCVKPLASWQANSEPRDAASFSIPPPLALTNPTLAMGQSASMPQQQPASATPSASSIPASCPMHQSQAAPPPDPAKCPVDHVSMASAKPTAAVDHASAAASKPAACPIKHDDPGSQVNPLNQMPTLSQDKATNQSSFLPTDRTVSSIPRDSAEKWEYPSPQQFYNALARKGWETPEEHVETMVHIHNFLNEQAWLEVVKWEKRQNE